MLIYIIINIFLLLFCIIDYNSKRVQAFKEIKPYLFWGGCALLIIFAGFRNCGFDFDLYFDRCTTIFNSKDWLAASIDDGVEPGFGFLSSFLSFRILLVTVAFFTIFLLCKFLYANSPYPFISLFLYLPSLYMGAMGQIRQALAIVIVLLALKHIENKKKFILYILLATSFHVTALITFILFIFPKDTRSVKFYIAFLISAFILNFSFGNLIGYLLPYLPSFISVKLDFYINIYDANFEGDKIGFNAATLLRVFIILLGLSIKDRFTRIPSLPFFFNIYFLGTCMYIGFGFLPTLATRMSYTFTMLDIVMIPMLLLCATNSKKIILACLIIFLVINRQMPFLNSSSKYYPEYVPYKSNLN